MSEDQENNFHKRCDNIGPTLSLYKIQIQKNSKNINCIFGGYSSKDWDCSNKFKNDSEAFIFSVTAKKVFKAKPPYNSIVCGPEFGPSFGIKNISNSPELFTEGRKGYYYSTDTFGDNEIVIEVEYENSYCLGTIRKMTLTRKTYMERDYGADATKYVVLDDPVTTTVEFKYHYTFGLLTSADAVRETDDPDAEEDIWEYRAEYEYD